MVFRFGAFELDEARRELRLDGREQLLQPLVFDLLLYLVRHSDRVIPKDELLEALWPRVVVTESSLLRAVSLARAALRAGGAGEAIRTYARQGYRFCAPVDRDAPPAPASAEAEWLLAARRHHAQRDWAAALAAFAGAGRLEALTAADLERWADAAQWSGRSVEALEPLERAIATSAAAGDRRGAARACLLLARINNELLNLAVGSGWHERAASYLDGLPECREHGLRAWLSGYMAIGTGELEATLRHCDEALAIGRRLEDPDVECLALTFRGMALIGLGRVAEGVALQDQAAALVLAASVSPWVGGEVYCAMIFCGRHRCDWARAAQWTEQFSRWCTRHNLDAFPGTCRVHRAEVLGLRGEYTLAEQEIRAACDFLARGAPWAEGEAWRILGDLHLARDELEAAEQAYRRAHARGWDPLPGLALLHAARGESATALRMLRRALTDGDWAARQRRSQLLGYLASLAAASGELEQAREALAELESDPVHACTPALRAQLCRARGELALAEWRNADAVRALREAADCWRQVGAPLEAARARLRLAEALLADQDPDSAALELDTALDQLGQAGLPAAAGAKGLHERLTAARRTAHSL